MHGLHHRRDPQGTELEGIPLEAVALHDMERVRRALARVRPAAIVNAAGLTRARCVDPRQAWLTNAYGPRVLAACARNLDARLIHVSTDCVFRGDRGPYGEADRPDALDVYGRSKAAGELRAPALTVRTSFVGPEVDTRHGLLAWLQAQSGTVHGWRNHLWSGLAAPCLARLLLDLALRPEIQGTLHVHGQDATKAELLRLLAAALALDVQVEEVDAPQAIDRRLRSSRLAELGIVVPSLAEQVAEIATWKPPMSG